MARRTDDGAPAPASRQAYPEDRFDRVRNAGRVGAHRVTARPRYVWQYLIGGLLGFALLTTVGVLAVQSIGGTGGLPIAPSGGSSNSAAPKAQAELDPEATIAILNGTTTPNLASALDKIITDEQWGKIGFSGSAATPDVAISAVFYSDPADEAAAAGLAEKLGGVSTYTSKDYESYGVRLVVLLGADYKGPGLDEAAKIVDGTADNGSDAGDDAAANGAGAPQAGSDATTAAQ